MRSSRPLLVLVLVAVLTACGTEATPVLSDAPSPDPDLTEASDGDAVPADADETEPAEPDADEPAATAAATTAPEVRMVGATIEVLAADGTVAHGWTLHGDETFHSFLVRPGGTADVLDVVAVALQGERPFLYHLSVRAGGAAALAAFPEHLQPAHEVDTSPPAIAWTPDASSIVWTETTGEDLTLRTVGWDDGPGTGRQADDNASFALDLPADAHVDGFELPEDGRWILLLRDGVGEVHEVTMERQADGALAIPTG
jgi:hypothetical protein